MPVFNWGLIDLLRTVDGRYIQWVFNSKDELLRIQQKYPEFLAADLYRPKWEVLKSIGDDVIEILETAPFAAGYGSEDGGPNIMSEAGAEKAADEVVEYGLNPAFVSLIIQVVLFLINRKK